MEGTFIYRDFGKGPILTVNELGTVNGTRILSGTPDVYLYTHSIYTSIRRRRPLRLIIGACELFWSS